MVATFEEEDFAQKVDQTMWRKRRIESEDKVSTVVWTFAADRKDLVEKSFRIKDSCKNNHGVESLQVSDTFQVFLPFKASPPQNKSMSKTRPILLQVWVLAAI